METGPGDGASILNLPHDTEARTLLAWLGILSGLPRLHEQPLRSYGKTVMADGRGAGSNAPRKPPAPAISLYVWDTAFWRQEA